jgi:urease accessory protein
MTTTITVTSIMTMGTSTARDAGMIMVMTTSMSIERLLVWFSPAFPIGAFSFSHGLEWAVEAGDISDRDSLERWLGSLIRHGSGWTDAVLFSVAHRAIETSNAKRLREAAELAIALQPSKERRLEATMQGDAFVKAVETAWANTGLDTVRLTAPPPFALCIAAACASAGAGIAREAAVTAFLTVFAQNLVSAAVRLAPIGQSDGLRVLAALEPIIAAAARKAAGSTLKDAGGLAFRSDIASMRHETQMTRLFRS